MTHQDRQDPDQKTFEARLAQLRPHVDRLARDRLMFALGHASAQGPVRSAALARWAWPTATAAMSAVAATLLAMLLVRPMPPAGPQLVEQSVPARAKSPDHVHTAAAPAVDATPKAAANRQSEDAPAGETTALTWLLPKIEETPGIASYGRLRRQVLARGPEAWQPAPPTSASPRQRPPTPVSYRDLLDDLLDSAGSSEASSGRPAIGSRRASGANS